ncbi:MAG: PTS sugar transporter subunit IIC [Bacillota bacterium]
MKNISAKIKILAKRWFIDGFSGMALGLFCTLLIGLIIKQVGTLIGGVIGSTLYDLGVVASALMGAGIGAGVARSLKADRLLLFSAIVAGMMGAQANAFLSGTLISGSAVTITSGEPVGAFVASVIAIEIGFLVAGKTKVDIIVVPFVTLVTALIVTWTICPGIIAGMNWLGEAIQLATTLQPLLMGVVLAVVIGCLLTLPISSAAICISLKLGGIAGGAAVVGCACQMIGFAVMSYRENKFGGLIAQGLGTSMLQISNIFKKPVIALPPIIASAICGPLATMLFSLSCDYAGAGMGTCGLVGVFSVVTGSAGTISSTSMWIGIALLMFILPAVICLVISEIFRKKGIIEFGDLALDLK